MKKQGIYGNMDLNKAIWAMILVMPILIMPVISAVWSQSLSNELKLYFNFDSATEVINGIFSLNNKAGTMFYNNTDCLIGNCTRTYRGSNFNLTGSTYTNLGNGSKSMNFWFKVNNTGSQPILIYYHTNTHNIQWFSNQLARTAAWTGVGGNIPAVNNTWTMFTWTRNSSGYAKLYLNATLLAQGISTLEDDAVKEIAFGGYQTDPIGDLNGTFDEMGFWNKTLSQSEITRLYNNGIGMSYEAGMNGTYIYNATTYETMNEGFYANITYNNSKYSSITSNLIYNGTSYSTTRTGDGGSLTFTKSLGVGSAGNKEFYWTFNMINLSSGTEIVNSTTYTQAVTSIQLALCNSTLITQYVNFTFKDEATNNEMNGSISSSIWSYWLGDGTSIKSLSYSNISTNVRNFPFCFSPADKTLHHISVLQYLYTDYPQRKYSVSGFLTNSTLNKVLYLLGSADGIYVTFQVADGGENPIAGVSATASRDIGGTLTQVESGVTGDDGGVTFWLNPNQEHTFVFNKSGYDSLTTSLYPTQSQYTIYLGGTAATETTYDYNQQISYSINPTSSYLSNGTDYSFNFTISSTYWNIQKYGFSLWNETTELASISDTTNGGTLNYNLNTGENSIVIMRYYWTINGTSSNASVYWWVLNTEGSEWSIKTFFIDLKSYMTSGMFGLDNFGLTLLTFFAIFIIGGIMSYKYGLTSPAAIMGIIFTLTLFFDVGLGMIPKPSWLTLNIPFVSIFMGIIFIGVLFREVSR